MFTLLMLGSGIFWTATYLLIIHRSFLDHTYGMPLVALCANISWECIFSFIYPPTIIQHVVDLVWFSLDVVLFLQLLRFGPREFADLSRRVFYALCGLALVTSFGLRRARQVGARDAMTSRKSRAYPADGSRLRCLARIDIETSAR